MHVLLIACHKFKIKTGLDCPVFWLLRNVEY